MAAEFVSFTQAGRRVAVRFTDILSVQEPETSDDDQRVAIVTGHRQVRIEEPYDTVIDRLNQG